MNIVRTSNDDEKTFYRQGMQTIHNKIYYLKQMGLNVPHFILLK